MAERLMLLDTASLYFRSFYGVPTKVQAPDGTPVNAARGLLDIIAKLVTDFEPTHLVACWDDDWRPQWRVDLIPSYKEHRVKEVVPGGVDVEETPDELVAQIPLIREMLDKLGVTVLGAGQHEADDVIGSLASQAQMPVDVVTGDRDLFQLVDDDADVRIMYTARGMSRLEVLTNDVVKSKYGVAAHQYADFAALRGDNSDGLPGVAGVGDKTAAGLLQEHGSLARIIAAAEEHSPELSRSVRAKITAAEDYLKVAPTVVGVVRDLDFGSFDAQIRPLPADRLADVERFAEEHGLGGSMKRALHALGTEA
ncbi:5'-3' exonuclease [Arthrobacter sp. H14]|uniref:5'-3' exonuclease n=1 Tax=Arthrobacter sp. H14 TaxID=1312959 RepID=UPI00047B42E1|nr:5'-3' exonuclease [Arthrobacter sp. H14]